MKTKLTILSLAIALCSCVPTGRYYWGSYSQTQYLLIKNADDAARKSRKDDLMKIIQTSRTRKQPIPPGVAAEMGYLLYNEGSYSASLSYFKNEMENYPESTQLMQLIIKKAEDLDKEKAGTDNKK
jgi:hypothetical protein